MQDAVLGHFSYVLPNAIIRIPVPASSCELKQTPVSYQSAAALAAAAAPNVAAAVVAAAAAAAAAAAPDVSILSVVCRSRIDSDQKMMECRICILLQARGYGRRVWHLKWMLYFLCKQSLHISYSVIATSRLEQGL